MLAPPGHEQNGDRSACSPGEGGGVVDVLKAPSVVVPAEQQ
ncbi:hypothetical protein ACFY20_34075 [Streptomyces sp. NPDC001312]